MMNLAPHTAKPARPMRTVGKCNACGQVFDLPGSAHLFLLGTACKCRRGLIVAHQVTDRRAGAVNRQAAWTR